MDLGDSNPDPAASDLSLGHHLNETAQSQPTSCNSHQSSPVPEGHCSHDDNVVELEVSQDELHKLDKDESTDFSMETLQDSQILKRHLHDRQKQVKKAEKQARLQQLHSQLVEMDHQLDMLKQKTLVQFTTAKGSSQPTAASTPHSTGHQD